jgi:adenylosuccinate synthase
MTHKVYVVTDLGPGDGGKGGVVHKIANTMRAHAIIKRGGAQGSHGVHTAKGQTFAFSQWGCGTFEGIPTHASEQMIISPEGLLNESAALRYEHGIDDPFALLTVDERAVCATPFHGIASRLKELARRDDPRGTVGTGAGEAYRMWKQLPDLTILAGNLRKPDLRDRLAAIRDRILADLQPVVAGEFLASDYVCYQQEVGLLYDDGFLDYVAGRFVEAARQVTVVSSDYLGSVILPRKGVAVIESSHGVLTDRLMGFHPHTSAIRTLPGFSRDMLAAAGYGGQVVNIGVTRAYANRHGAGPMPTADPLMAARLLPPGSKDENRYQGEMRVGALDLVLLRYAVETCAPTVFDGLAVTCLDQVQAGGSWEVCDHYDGADDPAFFTPQGAIRVDRGTGSDHFEHQAALGRRLLECKPEITTVPMSDGAGRDSLTSVVAATMQSQVGIPVRMVSFGPTEQDKFLL